MQRILQRTETINPHLLAMLIVLIAYGLFWIPAIKVVYEEISPNPTGSQETVYIHLKDSVNSLSECRWVEVEWETKLAQNIFWVFSEQGFGIVWFPIFWGIISYLSFYRPPIFRFTLFVILILGFPVFMLLLFRPDVVEPFNGCGYVPVLKIKSVYPTILATIIWSINLLLSVILMHKISIEEKNKALEESTT